MVDNPEMNKREAEEKLYNDFPDQFKYRDNPKASLMCFGVACGPGWYDLIYKLCSDIQEILDQNPDLKERFYVRQIKEKFAGLRFYVSVGNREIFELIKDAELKSFHTCEMCGKPAKITYYNHWYSTLCSEHTPEGARVVKFEHSWKCHICNKSFTHDTPQKLGLAKMMHLLKAHGVRR